jgi:hypothetical protein
MLERTAFHAAVELDPREHEARCSVFARDVAFGEGLRDAEADRLALLAPWRELDLEPRIGERGEDLALASVSERSDDELEAGPRVGVDPRVDVVVPNLDRQIVAEVLAEEERAPDAREAL